MTGEKDYTSTAIYDRPAYRDDERQALEALGDKMRDSVASVIERHLPCPDAIDPDGDSFRLVWDLLHISAEGKWHKKSEQKNLKDLRRALIQAQRAWLRLHPVLRYTIAMKVAKMPPEVATAARDVALAPTRDNKTKLEAAWMVFEESTDEDVITNANKLEAIWKALPDIADFLEPGIRHAKAYPVVPGSHALLTSTGLAAGLGSAGIALESTK